MKNLFILLFICLVCSLASAQFSFRPQIGINSSTITENINDQEWKSKLGYQFGFDLLVGDRFVFQPGILFETTNHEFGFIGDIKVSRIRVPVLFGVRVLYSSDRLLGLRVFTGPDATIVVNKNLDNTIDEITKEDWESAVIGWNLGAGMDLTIFFIDLGYKFGVTKVFKNLNDDAKNNLFFANAGIRIGL